MKILLLTILLSVYSCQPGFARQYNVAPYSKQREFNGRSCDQFYIYEAGKGERYIGSSCN
jgi:hypothetical protein